MQIRSKRQRSPVARSHTMLACVWFVLFSIRIFASVGNTPIDSLCDIRLTVRDGVPINMTTMTQARNSHLWLGMTNGLYRFDGVTLEHSALPSRPEVAYSHLNSLPAVRGEGLWIGYRPSKVGYVLDRKAITSARIRGYAEECRDSSLLSLTAAKDLHC
jgi:ligand-binding sensor domain-containing protein